MSNLIQIEADDPVFFHWIVLSAISKSPSLESAAPHPLGKHGIILPEILPLHQIAAATRFTETSLQQRDRSDYWCTV